MARTPRREHLGQRYGVKLSIPPEGAMQVAMSRTNGMVNYFLRVGGREMQWVDRLYVLCASCYLQGINDVAEAEALKTKENHAD